MPTTSNFGWTTPADTDLVKDGAAAIRTLGNGIDTSLLDLKGGTTGQILSKASNTDLDYTWINNDQGDITAVTAGTGISGGGTSGAVTITNSMATEITAAGDIIVGTGSGTFDNLPIGTTGQVLTADTTVSPYKVKWAAASGGGSYASYTLLNAGGTALTGSGTITISSIVDYERFLVLVIGGSSATAGAEIQLRINGDSGATKYTWAGGYVYAGSTYTTDITDTISSSGVSYIPIANMSSNAASTISAAIYIDGGRSTGGKSVQVTSGAKPSGGSGQASYFLGGVYNGTAAITSISVLTSAGNFDAGTIYVYGSAN